jgi:biopolymer transport protein ExbD
MGKVKVKKSDVWIDMTPMSDVMTLLLTFFMLTSTFVKNEPVKVNVPGSVSEIKVPENGVLTILVNPEKDAATGEPTGEGQVFMSIDNTEQLGKTLSEVMPDANALELDVFTREGTFGVPLEEMKTYLSMSTDQRHKVLPTKGIPLDSIDGGMSEFQRWVDAARTVNENIKIALKADATTPYKTVKKVMSELQDMDESHYYMITNLKASEDQ